MTFFAQVDLAVAALAAPGPLDLPASGLLSLFADYRLDSNDGITGLYSWEQQGVAVIHSPAGSQLVRLASPLAPLPSAALAMVPMWSWSLDPPDGVDLPDHELDALDELERAYEADLEKAAGQWHLNGRHQLGGHARYIQQSVEEEVVRAIAGCYDSNKFDSKCWEAAKSQVPEWRLILQVESDSGLDVMWGDVGTLYWEARRTDAAAGRWQRPAFNFQCS